MLEHRNVDGLTEKEFLAQYRPADYERPSVTVDMLLFTVDDKEIKNMIEKSMALFDDNMNNILDTLGGLNE